MRNEVRYAHALQSFLHHQLKIKQLLSIISLQLQLNPNQFRVTFSWLYKASGGVVAQVTFLSARQSSLPTSDRRKALKKNILRTPPPSNLNHNPHPKMRKTLIFAGSSVPELTNQICMNLGMAPAGVELSQFANVS